MANALLDFVMSVVNDPDVAAAYAADPAKTIADANLHGVTTADVNGLIPVVSESVPSAAPGATPAHDANVWTSGAADKAFDAFGGIGEHLQGQASDTLDHFSGRVADHVGVEPSHVISDPGAALHSVSASAISDLDAHVIDHGPVGEFIDAAMPPAEHAIHEGIGPDNGHEHFSADHINHDADHSHSDTPNLDIF
jgi:hypothetical protein